jgi:hypothetical protein
VEVFNVYCTYKLAAEGNNPGVICHSAAKFEKAVTANGGEIEDNSEYPKNPNFQVECDNEKIFNHPSRRFTDRQGTRIQAQTGPYPAIVLPQGALTVGRQAVKSTLELRDVAIPGACFVYTGPQ